MKLIKEHVVKLERPNEKEYIAHEVPVEKFEEDLKEWERNFLLNHSRLTDKDNMLDDSVMLGFYVSTDITIELKFSERTLTRCFLTISRVFIDVTIELHHIKTLDQFKELFKALKGEEF